MPTVRLNANQSVLLDGFDRTFRDRNSATCILESSYSFRRYLAVGFSPNASYKYNLIDRGYFAVFVNSTSYGSTMLDGQALLEHLNLSTIQAPEYPFKAQCYANIDRADIPGYTEPLFTWFTGEAAYAAAKNGIYITDLNRVSIETANSSNKPFLELELSNTQLKLTAGELTPAGGYIDDTVSQSFSWTFEKNGYAYGDDEFIASSVFQFEWRLSASSTTNTITGTAAGCSVPANTFPSSGTFQARLKLTDALNNVSYSSWYTFSTTEASSTAVPLSPKNDIVSASTAVRFQWRHEISTSTPQRRVGIQISSNPASWGTEIRKTQVEQFTDIDLTSYTAGQLYWRVRTYNSDNVAGSWSDPCSFILLAPPSTPIVSATKHARPVITWQGDDQQAYEVMITDADGVNDFYRSGPVFGSDKNLTPPVILADGRYLISVRIQNQYGLWSSWGNAALTVANPSIGNAIVLTATAENYSAVLTWTSSTNYVRYLVYRDNVPIAVTTSKSYTDRFALGNPVYEIYGIPNGWPNDYHKSNSFELHVCVNGAVVAGLNDDSWIKLEYSTSEDTVRSHSYSRSVSFRHFLGADYPVAEVSDVYDEYVSLSVAFKSREQSDAFRRLCGKPVVYKAGDCDLVVGVLSSLSRSSGTFFEAYSCEIRRTNHDEAVPI